MQQTGVRSWDSARSTDLPFFFFPNISLEDFLDLLTLYWDSVVWINETLFSPQTLLIIFHRLSRLVSSPLLRHHSAFWELWICGLPSERGGGSVKRRGWYLEDQGSKPIAAPVGSFWFC